jgi:acetolactate synthase regulatory subunit
MTLPKQDRVPRVRGHRGSHVTLVDREAGVDRGCAAIDAIVVPTARPATHLSPVADLARAVGCLLVVLCSARSSSRVVAELVTSRPGLRAAVVDLPSGYRHRLLELRTSRHPQAGLAKHLDLSTKRNLGLLLARLLKWRQVLFVDDDIRGLDVGMLARGSSLLGRYAAVGFRVGQWPDNSVVCHAHRLGGGDQDTFVGGSALLVDTTQASSFFPAVYNEDWLFLHDQVRSRKVACAGRTAQLTYDPFASPLRASSEEFGDLIAETLFSSLHGGAGLGMTDRSFWRTGVRRRSAFLEDVTGRLLDAPLARPATTPPLAALAAARARLEEIEPEDCQAFVADWRADLSVWSDRLLGLPSFATERQAFDFLGLPIVSLEVTR